MSDRDTGTLGSFILGHLYVVTKVVFKETNVH